MSKILENKQVVHIACEVVALIGLVIHFSKKNTKLNSYIDEVVQRLEEQEELIKKHEQLIGNLVQTINNMKYVQAQPVQEQPIQEQAIQQKSKKHSQSLQKKTHTMPPLEPPKPVRRISQTKIDFNLDIPQSKKEEKEDSSSSEDEEDLDAEIAEELQELISSELDLK